MQLLMVIINFYYYFCAPHKNSAIIHVKDFGPQRVDGCTIYFRFLCGNFKRALRAFSIIPSL